MFFATKGYSDFDVFATIGYSDFDVLPQYVGYSDFDVFCHNRVQRF